MRVPAAPSHRRQHRWWIWLCLVGLLGFQSMGLVHRAMHGGRIVEPARLALLTAQTAAQTTARAAGREASIESPAEVIPQRFGHAAGGLDCQLLDQLSHALGPTVQALAWTALLPDFPVSTPQPHSAPLAQVWRKSARGPPLA
ncbi:hypothetical protein CDN99_07460 [Roseateles aquatilis]|uniref:Uncharacterized protein n=1 Tax=Roseateles aquatilis TaxID=431061 RepID=A0A246JHY2_9BURK|nr:hypothetical protein [Roseateles aquatilis]OWQ92172.1 hypothetical protein CDN99_07460 [Roseateles aquatilis]